jgi:alpha/beta superfamily hydrolase
VPRPTRTIFFDGLAGPVQTLVDAPETSRGLAVVAHPHPLFGGTNQNKVVYTLAHCLRDLGYLALRPNFRGVGASAGSHDQGRGETDDLVSVVEQAVTRWGGAEPLALVLAGFSFGAFVQTRVARRLREAGRPAERVILVALATGSLGDARPWQPEPVPPDSILMHGDRDTTVPLANVLAYAEPLGLRVHVIPDADHFFHGRLQLIQDVVRRHWSRASGP